MIRERNKIIDIVNDFLIKNDTRVDVNIEYINFNGYDEFKAVVDSSKKDELKYTISYNLDYWTERIEPMHKYPIDYAKDIVSTMLHEATHIICHNRKINTSDGSHDFEKMIYENYLNSNHDNPDGRFLSELIGISQETYLDNYRNKREDEFFIKYINYITYLMGQTDRL